LKNLLLSVLAGGSTLAVIAVAIIAVSNFDKVSPARPQYRASVTHGCAGHPVVSSSTLRRPSS
jgi:hypothetical protein